MIILRLTVHDCRPSCQQFHSTNNIVIVRPNRRQGYVARVEGERRRGSSPEANHGERGRRLQDVPQVARLLGLQEKDVGARQQLCRPSSNDFPGNAVWVFRWVAVCRGYHASCAPYSRPLCVAPASEGDEIVQMHSGCFHALALPVVPFASVSAFRSGAYHVAVCVPDSYTPMTLSRLVWVVVGVGTL